MADYNEVASSWLNGDFDSETKCKIIELRNNDPAGFEDAFYRNLEFGTGGLRGIMGVGTNRMNKYTVGMATQGLANYILKNVSGDDLSVVISYDSRNNSKEFARIAADVMSANGINVFIFDNIRPTPEMSYAVRLKKAVAGIMITASHNPKEYNGYKVFWSDGGQITSPVDKDIVAEVAKITDPSMVKFKADLRCGEIEAMGANVDECYLRDLLSLSLSKELCAKHSDFKIVYTPLHGTGRQIIPMCLRSWGFQNIHVVPEQMVVDGDFPTVVSPNPENAEAMTLGMKLGTKLNADLVVATDPDADRLAIVCRDNKGEWMIINGNQTAMMFCYYIIKNKKALGQLKPTDFLVKTIVTTEVIAEIAKKNNVEIRDCYTGFKWIAREIAISEGKQKYIGGGEESFGYLPYDKVRDKDAPASICLICEIAAWAKDQGKTLYDLLMEIYLEYGFSKEHTINVTKPGKSGADEIKQMMVDFRANPPKELGGSQVAIVKDYKTLKQTNVLTGEVTDMDMPATSNVLQYFCTDGTKVSVRPSGTEPKIKFYCEVKDTMKCPDCYAGCTEKAMKKIEAIKVSLGC